MLLLDAETFRWLKSTLGSLPRGLSSSVTTGAGSLDLEIQQMCKMKCSVISSPALLILYLVTFSSAAELKRKTPVDLTVPFTSTIDTPSLNRTTCRVCPDGVMCRMFDTCCPWMSPWEYSCCPLPNAVCCPDLENCCPAGYICSLAYGGCISEHKFH
ncbi:hypothetical protein pdam_00020129 [Pocillopora damicornis]|uniref:Granulins domain-containing protein n=1 Tax=Pocillopora damicornis TaxID=46731 RepID=A0A3M6UBT5_POCDA|nr:hypothetical protein pdam_00020129 [Pocillopora damicornis]